MSTPGAVPASMAKRLLAFLIDQVAYLVLGGALVVASLVPMLGSLRDGAAAAAATDLVMLPLGFALILMLGVFQWWYQGTRGWTVGKRAVGLRTLSADDGRPVGMGRMLLRLLVVAAGTLVLGVGQLVVHVSPFFDRGGRRQGWHDKAAGTVVFDVALGRDPSAGGPGIGAPEASRRLDSLLQGPARPPGGLAPAVGTVPALVPVRTVSALPRGGQVRDADGEVISAVPGSADALLPRTPASAAPPAPSPPPLPPPPPPPPPPPASAAPPAPPAPPAPVAQPAPAASSAPRRTPRPADRFPDLPEDVEATQLTSAARRRVPVVQGASIGPVDPSAILELWDGSRLVIERTLLVGRNPSPRAGEASPGGLLQVPDPGRSVSKTHLVVGVDRQGVWLRDRSSTNGTVVTLPDRQQILCAPDQQVRVPVGATVAFGDFWFTVGLD